MLTAKTKNIFFVLDGAEAILIGFVLFMRAPFHVLRSLLSRSFWVKTAVLSRYGILSAYLRATLDFKRSYFESAVALSESMATILEQNIREVRLTKIPEIRFVAISVYDLLARAHLYRGMIDDAAIVVLRAHRQIGVNRLPHLNEMDAKTAQIVQAAISAGRLIGGGGIAQVIVDTATTKPHLKLYPVIEPRRNVPKKKDGHKPQFAKIIPFPH